MQEFERGLEKVVKGGSNGSGKSEPVSACFGTIKNARKIES